MLLEADQMASDSTGDFAVATPSKMAEPASEGVAIAAICNRVSRMLGLLDREGLHRDLSIVRDRAALDLEALLAAPDAVFIEELLRIVDCADRNTGALTGTFSSRFTRS